LVFVTHVGEIGVNLSEAQKNVPSVGDEALAYKRFFMADAIKIELSASAIAVFIKTPSRPNSTAILDPPKVN